MFTLSPEETTAFIKKLKTQVGLTATLKSSQNNFSTTQDSALWEIEALLNYDFDRSSNSSMSNINSLNFAINVNSSNTIDLTEINSAYIYFSNQINQHLSANSNEKVKIIDLTATESNSILNLSAYVVYTNDNSVHKTSANPCDAYVSPYVANWSNYWMGNNSCSLGNGNDGPTSCETRLNCISYSGGGCSNGIVWSNVITKMFFTSANSSALFNVSSANYCQSPLSSATLNNYVTTSQTYGINNKPTSPSNYQITLYNIVDRAFPNQQSNFLIDFWWELDVTYATPSCAPPAGG